MAKVIIEVKDLQNNDLIGKVVLSKAGRDKDQLYIIIDQIDDEYTFLSNGKNKNFKMPKKKKLKHIEILDSVDDDLKLSIIAKEKGVDLKIKRFLKLRDIVKEG